MKILFMDISRNEDGEVLSVLGGCHKCGNRVVTCFIEETNAWLKDHQKTHHKDESTAIEQIGDPLEQAGGMSHVDRVIEYAQLADGRFDANDFAAHANLAVSTASTTLRRLAASGDLSRVKIGKKYLYKLKDAA